MQSDTLYFVPVFADIYGLAKSVVTTGQNVWVSWIKYSSTTSSLVSVLYTQNFYLLPTAVSFGVCGERNNSPGVQIKVKGEIGGKKKKRDSSKQKGEVVY